MQLHWSVVSRVSVMAAIVATLWYPPGAAIVLVGGALLGLSVHAVATFGDRIHAAAGMVMWWLVLFAPALAYSAVFMPWWED